jgi:hypothetical protein
MTSAERHAQEQLAGLPVNAYTEAAFVLLAETGCTVRRWRTGLSGVAHTSAADWGIQSPPPTTALRFGIFAHEVAHQVLHRSSSQPRWLEEIQAWEWSLDQFRRFDLAGAADAERRATEWSIPQAFRKALRRGVPVTRFYACDEARWWAETCDARALAESLATT